MPESNESLEQDYEVLLSRGRKAFYAILGISITSLCLYFWNFSSQGWSPKQDVWGQFGDFLGGILNPAVGLVTVYLILTNVKMQQRELASSIQELKHSNTALTAQIKVSEHQAFEQTFFTWLESYQNIVASVNFTTPQGVREPGRDGLLSAFQRKFSHDNLAPRIVHAGLPTGSSYLAFTESGSVEDEYTPKVKSALIDAWQAVYSTTDHHIAAMFRTLYRLILWVDSRPTELISNDLKWEYIAIARAQISDIELTYLFLNGFTKKGSRFVHLINKYALFDNLDVGATYYLFFLASLDDSPYTAEAYDSNLARFQSSASRERVGGTVAAQ